MYLETADIETASDDYASRFSGEAGNFFLQQQTEITLSLLDDLPHASILDVGGGHAQLACPLVKKGFNVTVTGSDDICRERLDKQLPAGSFDYITCDSLALPFENNSFDVVLSFRLLPHVTRWQELIGEMCRVANKCIILDYPDRRSSNILYEQFFKVKKKMEGNTRPFTLFSREQICSEVRKNNFDKPIFKPEFFFPMVIHRKLKNKQVSSLLETCSRYTGLTRLFGSPIIFRSNKTTRC